MALRFHLAGINNQNFLMKDAQTGTYWQQISGLAIAGPLAGRRLTLVPADELSFSLWKSEEPNGTVLQDAPGHSQDYAPENWDVRMARVPTVISYAQAGIKPRDLMLGVEAFGASRAFPYDAVLKQKLIQDYVGSEPVMLVLGPDNRSVRVFHRQSAALSKSAQFYRIAEDQELLMDADSGSRWNFHGCAVQGKLKGDCLRQVNAIKDYWFDWRNYHPNTSVYGIHDRIR
jgi:hypothetical protein